MDAPRKVIVGYDLCEILHRLAATVIRLGNPYQSGLQRLKEVILRYRQFCV